MISKQTAKLAALLFTALIVAGAGCTSAPQSTGMDQSSSNAMWSKPTVLPDDQISGKEAVIKTAKGDIVIELFNDTAPLTVSNFVYLANRGFYDGLMFHRREEGFVIQGGDPNGNGTGGPGYTFPDELSDNHTYDRGIVAMANRGANTNGSQFFIMLADTPLPKNYTIFGRVTSGMDVVDQIKVGDVMTSVNIESVK